MILEYMQCCISEYQVVIKQDGCCFFFFVVFFLLTQWLSQLNVMTAGPKERAGFMLAPV